MAEDPIFKIPTPILFAHRGGAAEVPESTWEAFEHAVLNAKVDLLELDVQLTDDNAIVLWHGPNLDNVWIEGLTPCLKQRKKERKKDIMQFRWGELMVTLDGTRPYPGGW
jgi:glycerophosphoryl diester phosphodiesterase